MPGSPRRGSACARAVGTCAGREPAGKLRFGRIPGTVVRSRRSRSRRGRVFMRNVGLRTAALVVVVGAVVVGALVFGRADTSSSSKRTVAQTRMAHAALREREQGEADGADAEAYSDRAYPDTEITLPEVQGAITADAKVKKKGPKAYSTWESLGPDTLNVDRLGTQSFIKATQWSGRVTALTVGPKCKAESCELYVGAAGGGVWRSHDALSKKPHWEQISAGIPTNAIGSIAVDPNDPTGKTVYVGTGEGNGSGDSEAGLGPSKNTHAGQKRRPLPGALAP